MSRKTLRLSPQTETPMIFPSDLSPSQRLHELEALSAALDETSIVAVTDPFGIINHANRRFCDISGYTLEELLGKNHRILNSGTHPKSFFTAMWQHIGAGKIWRGDICNRAKDGSLYWVDTTIVPITGTNGQVDRYISIRHVITQRMELMSALNASEARLNAILDASADGVVVLESNSQVRRINASAAAMLGCCPAIAIGRDARDWLPGWEPGIGTREILARNEAGQDLPLFLNERSLVHGGENLTLLFLRNLSEQKETERTLDLMRHQLDVQTLFNQRLSALAAMAGGIAHELNQPLSGIRVYADMVANSIDNKQVLDPQSTGITMGKIIRLVDRAASIIEHMRQFASEKSPGDLRSERLPLRQAVDASLELVGQQLRNRGIAFRNEIDASHLVLGNQHRLEQVFINLFTNSRDAIVDKPVPPLGGHFIRLRSHLSPQGLEVIVDDSGPGVPESVRDKLFDPFVSSKAPGAGTGLGLPICHGILKDCGASIRLHRTSPDGTSFILNFPRC